MYSKNVFLIGAAHNMKEFHYKKGMALLLAVLVLSVVLVVSITLLGFVIKQYNITRSSSNSVHAVYAADTGIECALLWDIRGHEFYQPLPGPAGYKVFPTSTASLDAASPTPDGGDNIDCFGVDISNIWDTTQTGIDTATTTFVVDLAASNSCVDVEVAKYLVGTTRNTAILSRGYNVSCANRTTDLNAVERAIKVRYIFN